jgi:hypothetical protein
MVVALFQHAFLTLESLNLLKQLGDVQAIEDGAVGPTNVTSAPVHPEE